MRTSSERLRDKVVECPECKGEGTAWYNDNTGGQTHDVCEYCDGAGEVVPRRPRDFIVQVVLPLSIVALVLAICLYFVAR